MTGFPIGLSGHAALGQTQSMSSTVLILLAALVLWGILTWNSLIARSNDVKNAFASLDAFFKQRSDLIPNLVATIKQSAHFEVSTLEKIVQKRSDQGGAKLNATQLSQADQETSRVLRGVWLQAEAYPDLK